LDQQQRLDNIAEELFYYVHETCVIKELFKDILGKVSISSPILNFRDALFHYKRMYEAAYNNDNDSFVKQLTCIEEHLNRGLKDFAIYLCANYYSKILHMMIDSTASAVNNITLPKLKGIYHALKNIVIEIRLRGQTIQHFDSQENEWLPDIVKTIEKFHILINETKALKRLYLRFAGKVSKEILKKTSL
jgi:hypothetical protein